MQKPEQEQPRRLFRITNVDNFMFFQRQEPTGLGMAVVDKDFGVKL